MLNVAQELTLLKRDISNGKNKTKHEIETYWSNINQYILSIAACIKVFGCVLKIL